MLIISKQPNPSGAYPAIQTWEDITPPPGYAEVPDALDMVNFYAYNAFVTLTIEEIEHTRQVEKTGTVKKTRSVPHTESVEKTREVNGVIETYYEDEVYHVNEVYYEPVTEVFDESYTVDTVTAYEPNVEAWEAWKASLPEPTEPEPTEEEDTSAMLIDHEFRLTMLELGLFDY